MPGSGAGALGRGGRGRGALEGGDASGRAPSSASAAAPGRRCARRAPPRARPGPRRRARMPPVSAASSSGAWSASAAQAAWTRPTSCSCSATSAARSRLAHPRRGFVLRRPAVDRAPLEVEAADRPEPAGGEGGPPAQVAEDAVVVVLELQQRVDAAERGVAGIGRRAQLRVEGVPVRLDRPRDQGEPSASPAGPCSFRSARATMTSRRRSRPWARSASAHSMTRAQSTGSSARGPDCCARRARPRSRRASAPRSHGTGDRRAGSRRTGSPRPAD